MNRLVNPASIGAPAAAYSHAVTSSAGSRLIHTSGVVPARSDGSVPEDLGEQAELVWDLIAVILEDAGFSLRDIVSYTTYVVVGGDLSVVMAVRDRKLEGHHAASTLLQVPALARPAWKVEIAVVAAAD